MDYRLDVEYPSRVTQLRSLATTITQDVNFNPAAVLVHGPPASGKSTILKAYLTAAEIDFSEVSCDQCLTARILLQRALHGIQKRHSRSVHRSATTLVIENFSVFHTSLKEWVVQVQHQDRVHVLILDHIDRYPGDNNLSDLMTCFARLPEISGIHNVVTVFVTSSSDPRSLITTSLPRIRFPAYTEMEATKILTQIGPLPANNLSQDCLDLHWASFCSILVESSSLYVGTDLRLLMATARRIWPQFLKVENTETLKSFGKLYQEKKMLFSNETFLTYSVRPLIYSQARSSPLDLTLQSKYVLCASYLASYNPPRYDIRFFSRAKDTRAKRRDTSRRKQLTINPRQLAAPFFDLERMLAILNVLWHEHETSGPICSNVDMGVQIATLASLQLIQRSSTADLLDSRTRWRVNVTFEYAENISTSLGFSLSDYLLE